MTDANENVEQLLPLRMRLLRRRDSSPRLTFPPYERARANARAAIPTRIALPVPGSGIGV